MTDAWQPTHKLRRSTSNRDIVELLKMAARNGNALAGEAADEIERLRDENARPHLNYEAVLLESKGEIDRLRTDNERLRGVEQDAVEWVEERTKRLRTDNARLRAALRDVSLIVDQLKAGTYKSEVTGVAAIGVIARAALEGKDE